jgi:putative hemolysin
VTALARDPNRFLATIQIGITLAGSLASATAAVALAEPLVPFLSWLGGMARPVAVVVVTLVLTFLTLVFGELAPKRVAMQHAERWSLLVARPLGALAAICRPVVWLLAKTSDLAVRVMGADPRQHREDITPTEIRDLVSSHRGFTTDQRRIISGAVEITERILREILVPRREAFTLDVETPVDQARSRLAASGHSRAPVVRHGNLDYRWHGRVARPCPTRRRAAYRRRPPRILVAGHSARLGSRSTRPRIPTTPRSRGW